jgi:succinoglycan biosynthesis transport protein ExoP
MDLNQIQQSIDLREYLQIVNKRKALIILPLIISVLTALAGTYFMEPVYESSTAVLVDETSLLGPAFSSFVPDGERRMTREQRQERLNTIRNQIISSYFLAQLINRLGIPISDKTKKTVTQLHRQFPNISEMELAQKIQIEEVRKQISVGFLGTNLVRITAEASSPVMATDMARTLAEIYIDESLASELVGVRGAMDFSDEMLSVYREQLRIAEDSLREFEQNMIKRSVEEDSALTRNINEINSAINTTDITIGAVSKNIEKLRNEISASGVNRYQINYSDDLYNIKFELLSQVDDLGDLLAKYSWLDPNVVRLNEAARQNLDKIEKEISVLAETQFPDYSPGIRQKIADLEYQVIKLSFLREKKKMLDKTIDKVKQNAATNPSLRQRHNELLRQVEENRRVYQLFSEQLTGSQINQAATRAEAETKFRIIEPAAIPTKPIKPNRIKYAMMAAALGLALGVGAVIMIEFMDNSFHKVEEIEAFLGLKVIGTFPRLELPYAPKPRGRIWVYMGTLISVALLVFVIYLSRQG